MLDISLQIPVFMESFTVIVIGGGNSWKSLRQMIKIDKSNNKVPPFDICNQRVFEIYQSVKLPICKIFLSKVDVQFIYFCFNFFSQYTYM